MGISIGRLRVLSPRLAADRAPASVCLFTFAAAILLHAAPTSAQWPVRWPEDDACRKAYSVSTDGYPAYIKCLVSNMPALDPKNRHSFGERYDPKKYGECRLATAPRDTSCEPYRLRRRPQPEYWPNAGKVPPVKWPEAPAQSVYRQGMKPKEYFDALCKAEAGEFIYRTVEGVEGIYQIRPRLRANDYELRDRYVLEDPYGYLYNHASKPYEFIVQPPFGGFDFLEEPSQGLPTAVGQAEVTRYYRGAPVEGKQFKYMEGDHRSGFRGVAVPFIVHEQKDTVVQSRYGYTWRGITRQFDRESNIAGGELAIIDLSTGEIVAIRRGFLRTRNSDATWETATACPRGVGRPGFEFMRRALKPTNVHSDGAREASDGTR